MKSAFWLKLSKKIIESVNNEYKDNFDFARYDEEHEVYKGNFLKNKIKKLAGNYGFYKNQFSLNRYFDTIESNFTDYSCFEFLYNNLESESSRELLVSIAAYRVMGYRKVKLPLNTPKYRQIYDHIKSIRTDSLNYQSLNNVLKLYTHDLRSLGFPLKIILSSYGILVDFVHEQYRYQEFNKEIKAEQGDVVIDGGGCYGDTALYFSHLVGKHGQVFSFEFVPSNLEVFNKNLSLNPEMALSVIIEKRPLADKSGKKIYFLDKGPASRISENADPAFNGLAETISIDDFVEKNHVNKVDLIKLDIEGSEYLTLEGARNTIHKNKPKLAIALYHSPADFDRIPRLIKDIEPGYRFYLKHATINAEETMLYACL